MLIGGRLLSLDAGYNGIIVGTNGEAGGDGTTGGGNAEIIFGFDITPELGNRLGDFRGDESIDGRVS